MKMIYGGTPVKSLKVKHYEISTNDCDMIASDLQAGKTAVARGQKIIGTGKCFSFAFYGSIPTNLPWIIPSDFNVIEIACVEYPVQHQILLKDMKDVDFNTEQNIATITINDNVYQIIASFVDGALNLNCDESITLQVFCGKDEYFS